jgi:hypothetical protein
LAEDKIICQLNRVDGIGQYRYDHPVETAMTVYAPGVMLPYRATKMTLQALGYTYNRLSRVDYKTVTRQKVFDTFEKIYKDLQGNVVMDY